ncbi:hypothetical protein IB274_29375 [Pseudomonas sp. PDM18]|uniref:hypothetical protein n=1 Tax=Pseudomonas sp. PDM18 TaxID=2769253 RepID=UPI0017872297|nr:hypothetical protein [Pseudomonas sp. PDM18]MBD9680848.1 hypothetical protein [Pseudomonas sp. PDM18]
MALEIQVGATLEDIASALSSLGESCSLGDTRLDASFDSSGCQFSVRCLEQPEGIVAEGCSMSWMVGLRGAFHCRGGNLSESWVDIKSFLHELSLKIECGFVLSFQYESIYAIRDFDGLSFNRSMID